MRWFLVDRLIQCDPGKTAIGIKSFTRSELFFMDHFPNRPLVPGVLQVEMVAQAAAACIRIAKPGMQTLLIKVHSAKFIKPIVPGDRCRIRIEILKLRGSYAISSGEIDVDDQKVAEAEVMFAIVQRENPNQQDPLVEDWKSRCGDIGEQNPLENGAAGASR
jgi:3-hydroxyacyl-[acyl-carrier-protein] dehydratase